MIYSFRAMTPDWAQAISLWSYPPPYDIYDARGTQEAIEEYLGGSYYAALDGAEELSGFSCFGTSAQVPAEHDCGAYDRPGLLDLGLGLRPDLCGRGLGLAFLHSAMAFGKDRFGPEGYRLTVAAFNARAMRVYRRAGFVSIARFVRRSGEADREFVVMSREIA